MPTIITSALRNWLADHDLQGFIKVAEVPPHPNAIEMANKLNIETLTDSMVKLGLNSTGERQFEILPIELLERYYGKYFQSAKALRTRDIPHPCFRDISKFLLDVGCAHINAYGMSKHKAGVVLATYEGTNFRLGNSHGGGLVGRASCLPERKKTQAHHPTIFYNTVSPMHTACPGD